MGMSKKTEQADELFSKVVGQPAIRALNGVGYTRFQQLAGVSRSELAALHGVGPKSLRIIQQALIDGEFEPMR